MSQFDLIAVLIVLVALFSYLNFRLLEAASDGRPDGRLAALLRRASPRSGPSCRPWSSGPARSSVGSTSTTPSCTGCSGSCSSRAPSTWTSDT